MKTSEIYSTPLDDDFKKFSGIYEALINEWETLSAEVPDAKHAYEMKFAEASKTAEGTIPMQKAEATLKTRNEYLALLKAEAKLEFVKAKVKWADKELSILQTRASNMRSEMQMSALPSRL